MYEPDRVRLDASHHDLLAEHGEKIAVVATINLDAEAIVGVQTFHEYDGTYTVESCHPIPDRDRVDAYYHMLNYFGDAPDVIRKHIQHLIEEQEYSDDPTAFTWELVGGIDEVETDESLQETLETRIGPDRLDPPFDIPDDEPVATVSCTSEQHDIIKEANDRYGYAAVTIERFRGETYIIGLTKERARTIAEGCFNLKQEYSGMDMHESAESADRAESIVHDAAA